MPDIRDLPVMTEADAKALGLTTDVNGTAINYGTSDASVNFSSSFAFDFDPTDGISSKRRTSGPASPPPRRWRRNRRSGR